MEFKSYPNYKDSGVEWLGKVPEHWRISSLKRYGYFKGGAGFPHAYQGNTEENIPFFKVNSLSKDKRFLSSFSDFVGEETAKKLGAKIFPKNSIFFAKVGAALLLERIRTNQQPCCIDNNMMGFVIQNELSFDFAFYLMSLIDFKYLVNPGAVPSINESQISSFLISVPPISEQTQIANYLDTETARIDNLISKQEKLIELLEEQRKSIISHAVTKGLNPNAPMKDSGVEWLGDVPEHWMTPSSKHLLEIPITDGPHETPNFVDDGVPFISAEAISKGKIDFDKKRGYITPELNAIYSKKYSPKIEDIYMVKSGATTGKVAMVETTEEFNIWSPLAVFRCNKNKVLPKFLLAVFNSSHFYDALVLNWSYGTQQNIGMGVLSNIEIPCPPLKEQAEIIQHLDAQNTKFDKLISTQSQLIEKLKEYRASIISHAVTGKIDVREFGA